MANVNQKDKAAYMFNKYFYDMLLELKSQNDVLKRNIKRHYGQFDKMRSDIVELFYNTCKKQDTTLLDTGIINLCKVFGEMEFLKNISLNEILDTLDVEADKVILKNYMYLLWCFCLIWGMLDDDEKIKSCMIEVMRYHQSVKQFQDIDFNQCGETLSRIGVKYVLITMDKDYKNNADIIQGQVLNDFKDDAEKFMSQMGNSKLKNIANEVAQKMDMEKFKSVIEPLVQTGASKKGGSMEGLNFMELLGNPQVMGLVQEISGTIQSKLDQGELNNDDIMNEAQSLMGFLTSSGSANQMQDILGGVMQQAMGGQGGPSGANISQMMNMFSGMMSLENGGNSSGMDNQNDIIGQIDKMIGEPKK